MNRYFKWDDDDISRGTIYVESEDGYAIKQILSEVTIIVPLAAAFAAFLFFWNMFGE